MWTMRRIVNENDSQGSLRYHLVLRTNGQAIMTVERTGLINGSHEVDEAYGSMLSVYLKQDTKVVHTGTWTAGTDDDHFTILLTRLAGHKDNAHFVAERRGRRMRLTAKNPGLYGHDVHFILHQEGDTWEDDPRNRDDQYIRDRDNREDRDRRDDDWDRDDRRDRNDRNDQGNQDDRYIRRPGSMVWRGTVDEGAVLYIRQDNVRVESTNNHAILNTRSEFRGRLPLVSCRISVVKDVGRGDVTILEQPSSRNDYTAVVKVNDPQDGRGDYKITVSW
jgi:hypothetical protein